MRVRVILAVALAAAVIQPLAGGSAQADERTDLATQAALAVGQTVGAASSCPDIAQTRIKAVSDRFNDALKKFDPDPNVTAPVKGAYDQGVFFGGQAIGAKQTTCDNAERDLANLENTPIALTTDAPPPAPAAAAPPIPPPALLPAPLPPPAAASLPPATTSLVTVQGVTDRAILFGMAAPFSGAAKELGRQMKLGVETAFNAANDAGGIEGRKLTLVTADDGYEPSRTGDAMRQLYEIDKVFGFIGNVGTPTAAVALPYAMSHRALFFGALAGAPLLRADPPDRYVFNYRASDAEETAAVVRYLVKVRHLRPEQIAVFAQQDGAGDAGFDGVAAAIRSLSATGDAGAVPRFGYQRNTDDVDAAIAQMQLYQRQHAALPLKVVVIAATYRAAARFIARSRDRVPGLIYTAVSFVGSTALAKELLSLGPRTAAGVIVTQVVPPIDSYASVVLTYKAALEKYFPGEAPDSISFEGYLDATMLIEGLRRTGPQLDTEKLVDALEGVRDFDLGVGPHISFSSGEHQALHKVWGSQLDETGHYKAISLE